MRHQIFKAATFALCAALSLTQLACTDGTSTHQHHPHSEELEQDARGPHGGKLLKQGEITLELLMHEAGRPPHLHAYMMEGNRKIEASSFSLQVILKRLEGSPETISFTPQNEVQISTQEIREPHSYDVEVIAEIRGKRFTWSYSSYEARTTIPAQVAIESGIATTQAAPQTLEKTVRMRGKITPSEHRIAHIIPRFAGMVREGRKHIGDVVAKGEVLAIIESNQSLQPYEVRSQIAGTVINGHLIVGEYVPENQWVYIVADLSEVWADFFVPLEESAAIKIGQKVIVQGASRSERFIGSVDYVAPYADEKAQARLIRVVLPNPELKLSPGMFVTGDVVIEEIKTAVAVKPEAIQSFGAWQVVFIKVGDTYEARPLELGLATPEWVEVRSGLEPSREYVTKGSFTIKADILKHGATHDH